ncbi:MAG: hypothetical protein JO130_02380 [Solirubrobacterales bacterium]|nr:hypothetical protein [Solirubrobacterales bacterium]
MTHPPRRVGEGDYVEHGEALASTPEEFIIAAAERISARGRQEGLWYEGWQADYAAAVAGGDNDACELLLDVLIAFDTFQGQKRPTRLRRVT